ncbi:hypothetical protein [Mucilaginibacter polytrichastri]|uniref:Uncharacterized protein n=1 Tax=Mucilaginibacter polytrichastri TaxID=1302689 RepID=A0A1Q6A6N6_9SPHI|nr:hypothetical protein [Mucilaginibacter polytrichastri]OKS89681.1 hypothetical protein RG47T_5166 [Mucilaginibacter polytrichastri]SFT24998.1 hypothetical protein SAMN04487890_12272 [Mucilaginibacter polytrichastri]
MNVIKPKRKRIDKNDKVIIASLNDGTNKPVPIPGIPITLADGEADLYKQANNPLGDPHKI